MDTPAGLTGTTLLLVAQKGGKMIDKKKELLMRLLKKKYVVFYLQKSLGVFIRRLRINIYTGGKWIKLVVLGILMSSFLFISFDKCGIESVKSLYYN